MHVYCNVVTQFIGMPTFEFLVRVGLALLLGAAIGIERQWRQRSAGLRTNTLVSLGAAAFTLISFEFHSVNPGASDGDPTRIIAQIVTGIGFLGAGVIMRDGASVHGLNTAATIWCSAAVGTLCGVGLYVHATTIAVLVMLTHVALRPIGVRISGLPVIRDDQGTHHYSITIACKEQVENHIRVLLLRAIKNDQHMRLRSIKSGDNRLGGVTSIIAHITSIGNHDNEVEALAGNLTIEYGVTEVSWEVTFPTQD